MAPTFIQHASSEFGNSSSARTLAFASNVTAGSLLWAAVGTFNTGITVSVSDNLNGAWTQVAGYITVTGSASNRLSMWYKPNSAGGACTVTYTPSASAYLGVEQQENGGITHTSPVRAYIQNDNGGNTSTTPTTTNVSATAGDLVAAAYAQGSTVISSCTVASPFTLTANLHGATGEGLGAAYDLSAAGAEGATFTLNTAVRYGAMAIAFIPASAAPVNVTGGALAGGLVTTAWAPGPTLAGGALAGGVVTTAFAHELAVQGAALAGGVVTRFFSAFASGIGGALAGGVVAPVGPPVTPVTGGALAGGLVTVNWAPVGPTGLLLAMDSELLAEAWAAYSSLQTGHYQMALFQNFVGLTPATRWSDLAESTFNGYARHDTHNQWITPYRVDNGEYALPLKLQTWAPPLSGQQAVWGWVIINPASNALLWAAQFPTALTFKPSSNPLRIKAILTFVSWRYVP